MTGKKKYYRALTIAGSDSGGGAGIQADLKTFSALQCYGMSAVTALTAQNTQKVEDVYAVPPDFVRKQIQAIVNDIGVDAIKIGMLNSAEIVQAAVKEILELTNVKLVVDPVMVAKSGDKLLQDSAIEVLKEQLLPLSDIITPNIPEAEVLTGQTIDNDEDMKTAGMELLELGPKSVVVKGGHADLQTRDSADLLITMQNGSVEMQWLTGKRIETSNTHGTGCTYSSAMAAYLARGFEITEAVQRAKTYINKAIRTGASYKIGQGHGPVHHFHEFWNKNTE